MQGRLIKTWLKLLPAHGATNHTGRGRYGPEFICVIDEHGAEDRPHVHVVPREITRAVSCADREGSRKRVSGHMTAAVILFERNRPRPNYLVSVLTSSFPRSRPNISKSSYRNAQWIARKGLPGCGIPKGR